jgi:GT2 family glycosyltransferase
MKTKVEIVIPVCNRKRITLQCLQSLSRIDQSELEIHIIVVDDGSTDGTSGEITRCFPEVEILHGDGNLWYAGGTNCGMAAALVHDPDYILAVNDDTIFHDKFLRRLLDCAVAYPKSIVGALLLLWDRPHAVFQIGPRWDTWYGGWRHPMNLTAWTVPKRAFDVELIVGNCVLYPVEAIRSHGLMNNAALPHWWADAEYTVRMRKAGWRLLVEPKAYVWCQPNTIAPSMRSMPVKSIIRELLWGYRSQRSLIQLFKGSWHTAPSHMLGIVAFFIRVFRSLLHAFGFGGSWPQWNDPSFATSSTVGPATPAARGMGKIS